MPQNENRVPESEQPYENEKIYLNQLKHILLNGEDRTDRTGTGTRSLFGLQSCYNLEHSFPILTSKKIFWKGIVGELLWFLRGETNVKSLQKDNIHFWNDWANENGDLNNVYGGQWRRWEQPSTHATLVRIRNKENDSPIKHMPEMIALNSITNSDLTGTQFENKEGCRYTVLDKIGMDTSNKNSMWRLQFHDTGTITVASRPAIKKGQVKDKYALTVHGVACVGNSLYDKKLYDLWYNMIAKCYNVDHPNYPLYGGQGVSVSTEWKCFEYFQNTISQVPYYWAWNKQPSMFNLDKDYFGANQYSKTTAIFLDKEYNKNLSKWSQPFEFKGKIYTSPKHCADEYGLDRRRIPEVLSGKRNIDGYDMKAIDAPDGFIYRQQRIVDQIEQVQSSLINDPDSRRHIVAAWNPGMIHDMALPPCHAWFQFYVRRGEYLDCQLYQRSSDFFLGIPFNVASYSLLTSIMALKTNFKPGRFIHTIGDAHIYSNHIEQVNEQLYSRANHPAPKLIIDPVVKDLAWEELKLEHFKLTEYKSEGHLKAPIAV